MSPRLEPPARHGELLTEPSFEGWGELARDASRTAQSWDFAVGGMDVAKLRRSARRILATEAAAWSKHLGIHATPPVGEPGILIATGHQPDLFHAGVWVKVFLLQKVAESAGAAAIDLVVDSDTFDRVGVTLPRIGEDTVRIEHVLASGADGAWYARAAIPAPETIESFCTAARSTLASLPDPRVHDRFESFCEALGGATAVAGNLSELITAARRRYEGPMTDYLELPVTVASRSEPFLRFIVDIARAAERFAGIHNEELAAYRSAHGVRSAARPFPDLTVGPDGVELPFWLLGREGRSAVFARAGADGVEIASSAGVVTTLPANPDAAVEALAGSGLLLAPRALALTLFTRGLVADLFIHGIGGAAYDRVTEAVARRWWGVELSPFVTASLTMRLFPDDDVASVAEEVSAVEQRLHRLAHNPDEMVAEVTFGTDEERERALALAQEKRTLVEAISAEGADRKRLGIRIREVNAELASMLEPVGAELRRSRESLSARREAVEVRTDRAYPFFLWGPHDIADRIG